MEFDTEILNDFTIYMRGRFTFTDSEKFMILLDQMAQSGRSQAVIDLSSVDYIDSAGIGMLLHAREKSLEDKFALLLRHPAEKVAKMFNISGFDDLFEIEP